MPWFVKIEEGIVDKPTFDQHVPAHLAFVQDLINSGHHAQTGYWKQKGGGMLLFEASSMEEAMAIVERDPLVANDCVHYKLHEWHVVMGDPTGMDQCNVLESHVLETSQLLEAQYSTKSLKRSTSVAVESRA